MKIISVFLLLALALPVFAQEVTPWAKDPRVLSCSPAKLHVAGKLTLVMGPGHGRELGIRRHSDNSWYFLVIGSPPDNARTLMTPDEFARSHEVVIPASVTTTEWVNGAEVSVFSTSGKYSIYVSDNLESETGGYMCTIRYVK